MKHLLYILISSLFINNSFCQTQSLVKEIKYENATSIVIDHFDNYYIKENHSIYKYDKKNDFQYKYTDDLLNDNIYIDVSDPMKPLVLNKDFYTLSILDNRLGVINEVNLNEVYEGLVDVIISSSAQEYWIFDKQDNKLKKLNYDFIVLEESLAFQILFDSFSEIKRIRIKDDRLYILDNFGIKTFDLFGNFISQYKVDKLHDFQLINQNFVYFEEDNLVIYNPIIFQEERIPINKTNEGILEIKLTRNKIFYLTPQALKIEENSFLK